MDYETFIQNKSQLLNSFGFKPTYIPDYLFDFQKFLCDWAINKGRSAIFADTGLGKTPMQLVWSQNIVEHTNKSVLILTPLAVSAQTLREAEKFGMAAYKSREGEMNHGTAIYVTNYERLHYFDYNNFSGVVCDESSILKNFKGAIKQAVTIFMRKLPYRLLATATASPNDFIELGTSSEALGYLGFVDMLSKFFKNTQNTASYGGGRYHGKESKWRFKGYSETPFWKWVVSWARAIRKPSDIDFDDDGYILPKLIEKQHVIKARNPRQGELFDIPAITLQEQREERRITLKDRCELAAHILTHDRPGVAWAYLNDEGDLLEKLIPGAKQVKGSQSDDEKEEIITAFSNQQLRVLVTKPKITGFGLNWQHAHDMTFFPSHSYEQYYQCIRRMYRFGQKNEVSVNIVTSEGEKGVMNNLKRKALQADRMFSELVRLMNDEIAHIKQNDFTKKLEVPSWV